MDKAKGKKKLATPEQYAAMKFEGVPCDKPEIMSNQEAIDTALHDIVHLRAGIILLRHDDESLERLVRRGGKKGAKVFMKLVEKMADLQQRSKDRLKFCETVQLRLLVVMARMLDDKRPAPRAR